MGVHMSREFVLKHACSHGHFSPHTSRKHTKEKVKSIRFTCENSEHVVLTLIRQRIFQETEA